MGALHEASPCRLQCEPPRFHLPQSTTDTSSSIRSTVTPTSASRSATLVSGRSPGVRPVPSVRMAGSHATHSAIGVPCAYPRHSVRYSGSPTRVPSRRAMAMDAVSVRAPSHSVRSGSSPGRWEVRDKRTSAMGGGFLSRTSHLPGLDPLRTEWLGARTETASIAMARRLGTRVGEPLYRTECLGYAQGTPIALWVAWEPAILTLGTGLTPGERPDTSVAERLAEVGVTVDRIEEEVSVRRLREVEARRLALEPGTAILLVQRTHFAGRRVVETSDLIVSAEHCRLGTGWFPRPGRGGLPRTRTGRLPHGSGRRPLLLRWDRQSEQTRWSEEYA